jgi:hypothetical protein
MLPGFHEETAMITKNFWFNQNYFWNTTWDKIHVSFILDIAIIATIFIVK